MIPLEAYPKNWRPAVQALLNIEQQTDEWYMARAGLLGGSTIARVVRGRPTTWEKRIAELNAELARPEIKLEPDTWKGWDVDHGQQVEPEARAQFELVTGEDVTEVGLVLHPEWPMFAGCSPDGLTKQAAIEIKCPSKKHRHHRTVLTRKVPDEYWDQVQFEAWCCQRPLTYYVSYCPAYEDPALRLIILEVPLDQDYVAKMRRRIGEFIEAWDTGRMPVPEQQATGTDGVPAFFG